MGRRPVRLARITNPFAAPGGYASRSDSHGPAGHHTGIDLGKMLVPRLVEIAGQRVHSSTPGTVVISGWDDSFGNWVGLYYAKDNVTLVYCHMARRDVVVGQTVARGRVLGIVGTSGNSTAPHLHIQANYGRGFNYHGHIHPAKWCLGPLARTQAAIQAARAKRRAHRRAKRSERT